MITHCLDNQLTIGSEVVDLAHRLRSTTQTQLFIFVSGNYFC
jgi:hypothetical protein